MADQTDSNRVRAWWQTGASPDEPQEAAITGSRSSAWERAVNARRRQRAADAERAGPWNDEHLIEGRVFDGAEPPREDARQTDPSRFDRDDPGAADGPRLRGRFNRQAPPPPGGPAPSGQAAGSARSGASRSGAPNLYGDVISLSWSDLIPQPDLALLHAPGSDRARQYRALHAELALRLKDDDAGRAIAVTSHDAGVGRSAVAANLAVAFARSGMRALLIEADFERPRQLALFGAHPTPGIGDWICGRDTLSGVVFEDLPGLTLIPAGRGGPGLVEKLAHPGFRRWLSRISGPELAVIIDTAAAQDSVEAEAICAAAGGALLVSRRHTTDVRKAQRHTQRLAERGTAFFGAVVTG